MAKVSMQFVFLVTKYVDMEDSDEAKKRMTDKLKKLLYKAGIDEVEVEDIGVTEEGEDDDEDDPDLDDEDDDDDDDDDAEEVE